MEPLPEPNAALDDSAVELALARTVSRSAHRLSLPLVPLYLFFAVAHPFLLPSAQAVVMTSTAACTVIFLLALWTRARGLDARDPMAGHRYAAGIAGLVWLNSFAHLLVSREIHQCTNFALLVVGVGALFLSTRWFVAAILGTIASFVVGVAFARPSPLTVHFMFLMVSAIALSSIVFAIRRENAIRLEHLRQRDDAQRASLSRLSARLAAVLDAMGEGILVLDRDGRVRETPSREALRIFGDDARDGVDAVALLYPDEPAGGVEREALSSFLELAFESDEPWSAIEELAPTKAILGAGGPSARPIALDFRPVVEDGRIARVVMRARDESDKQALVRAIREQEEAFARRLTAMRRLAAGGGEALVSFFQTAESRCTACASLLEGDPTPGALTEVFQHVHAIKGEADALELVELRDAAHAVEEGLAQPSPPSAVRDGLARLRAGVAEARELLVQASPIGRAVLTRTSVDRSDIERLEAMVGARADDLGALARRLSSRPFGELVGLLAQRVATWAAQLDKRAELVVVGIEEQVPARLAGVLPAVLAQLARNAIAHGIEPPDARADAGKRAAGTLTLACEPHDRGVRISFTDDGRGVDPEIAPKIFEGFVSTATVVDDLSGRGVGLSSVAADLERAGYAIRLRPTPRGTCFEIAPSGVF